MIRVLAPVLLLAGCAAGTPTATAPQGAAGPPVQVEDGLPLRTLARQELPVSSCGLFLWTAGPTRKLVLMARTDTAAARIALAGGEVDLARAAANGAPVAGFRPSSRFAGPAGTIDWQLTIEQRPDVIDGAVVSAGSLSYTPPTGDAVTVPVAGIIGCRGA